MDEPVQPQNPAQDAPANSVPLPDPAADEAAVVTARADVDALVATIRSNADGVSAARAAIEQGKTECEQHLASIREAASAINVDVASVASARAAVEQHKSDIDQRLTDAKASASALAEQVESARSSAANLAALTSGIQAEHTQSAEVAKQAIAATESAKQIASTASEIVGRIEGIRDEAVKTQAIIAEKNAHIEGGLKHVAKVRREMDAAVEKIAQSAEAAERQHQASRASAEAISVLQLSSQATKERIDNDAMSVAGTRTDIEAHAVVTKKLADAAETTEARVAEYQAQLNTLIEQSQSQQKRIDELLAGATDAGLASAFDRRSKKFKKPEWIWQIVFVVSLLGLVGIAAWQAYSQQSLEKSLDWQQVARMLATKIPFAAPLVWLAIHAARQASLAKRLEEEYAFKATISMSFDGYRQQMAEIGKDLAPDSPLATLCNNTLREIAASPGRVYDGQRMDPNIASSVAEVLKPTVEAGLKTMSDKLPDLKYVPLANAVAAAPGTAS